MSGLTKTEDIVFEIKKRLLIEYFGEDDITKLHSDNLIFAWKVFIDEQSLGDSSTICEVSLLDDLLNVEFIIGEIEVDYPTYEEVIEYDNQEDDYIETEKEIYYQPHNWLKINGEIVELSKGSLVDLIDWDDLYSVDPEDINKYKEIF